jgi:hypothetical protein
VRSVFDSISVIDIIADHVRQACPTQDLACGMNAYAQESAQAAANPDQYIRDNISEYDLLTRLVYFGNADGPLGAVGAHAHDVPGVFTHQIAARDPDRQPQPLAIGGGVFYRDTHMPVVLAWVVDAEGVDGCAQGLVAVCSSSGGRG